MEEGGEISGIFPDDDDDIEIITIDEQRQMEEEGSQSRENSAIDKKEGSSLGKMKRLNVWDTSSDEDNGDHEILNASTRQQLCDSQERNCESSSGPKKKRRRYYIADSEDEQENGIAEMETELVLGDTSNQSDLSEGVTEEPMPSTSAALRKTNHLPETDDEDAVSDNDQTFQDSGSESQMSYSYSSNTQTTYSSDESFTPPDPYLSYIQNEKGKKKRLTKKEDRKMKKAKPKRRPTRTPYSDTDNEDNNRSIDTSSDFLPLVDEVRWHKINTGHNLISHCKTEVEKIDLILEMHNHNLYYIYDELKIEEAPQMCREDKMLFPNAEEFQVKVFSQNVKKTPPFFKQFRTLEKDKDAGAGASVHGIAFYYRKDEIYATTYNQGFTVLEPYCDYSFSGLIAARLLKTTIKASSKKEFASGGGTTSNKFQEEQLIDPFELLNYMTKTVSHIREDASLLKLNCFQDENNYGESVTEDDRGEVVLRRRKTKKKVGPTTPKVIIYIGALRINKPLRAEDFPAILNHLSNISQGKETVTTKGEPEKDSSAYQAFITPVFRELGESLTSQLCGIIHNAVANGTAIDFGSLDNFSLRHKSEKDWFAATQVFLKYKEENIKVWSRIPLFSEVVAALRRHGDFIEIHDREAKFDKLGNVTKDFKSGDDIFNDRVGLCKLSYSTPSKELPGEKLLKFVQGFLQRRADSYVYLLFDGKWHFVHPVYLYHLNEAYLAILRDHVSLAEDEGLECKWIEDEEPSSGSAGPDEDEMESTSIVQKYVKKYKSRKHYFVTSLEESTENEPLEGVAELPDMISLGRSGLNAYFIIPGFGYRIGRELTRISNFLIKAKKAKTAASGNSGRKSVGGAEVDLKLMNNLYHCITKKPKFKAAFPKLSDFLSSLQEVTFIIAFGPWKAAHFNRREEQDENEISLYDEKNLPMKISMDRIVEWLENPKNGKLREKLETKLDDTDPDSQLPVSKLAKKLLDILKTADLISSDGTFTTTFYVCSDRISFPTLGLLSKELFQSLLLPLQPKKFEFVAKIELIKAFRKMNQDNAHDIKIVEIES